MFQTVQFTDTERKKKNAWSLLFSKVLPFNFILSFYLLLKFDTYEHNCQPYVLSELLQRKTLYQSRFSNNS